MDGDSLTSAGKKKKNSCGLLIYKVLSPKGYLYGRDVDKVGPGFWVLGSGPKGSRNLVWVWWMHFIKKAGLGLGPRYKAYPRR